MIPQGTTGLIAFLVFVAPGAVFTLIWDRRRPDVRITALREVNHLVLVSLGAWVIPALFLSLPRFLRGDWGQALVDALAGGDAWRADLGALAAQGSMLFLLAIATAVIGALVLTGDATANIKPGNPWNEVLRRALPDGCLAYAWVTIADGTTYGGKVVAAKTGDVPAEEREIVLGKPLRLGKPGYKPEAMTDTAFLTLSGQHIVSLAVSYVRKEQLNAPTSAKV